MAPKKRPNVTTHALLGLLSVRSWTAYELTGQMRRALRYAWPRTEANLYSEIKDLAPRGLAQAIDEETGARLRTRYEITDSGRAAVADWLRTEPLPVHVQFETLLRVFLADQGTREELLAAITATRQQVMDAIAEVLPVVEDYASDTPPFPERAHLNSLFIAFIANFFKSVLEWCDTAELEVSTWPDVAGLGHTDGTRHMVNQALTYYRSVLATHQGQE